MPSDVSAIATYNVNSSTLQNLYDTYGKRAVGYFSLDDQTADARWGIIPYYTYAPQVARETVYVGQLSATEHMVRCVKNR